MSPGRHPLPTAVAAVVLAAGRGERFGGGGSSKLYVKLAGRPILAYSLAQLTCSPLIDRVVVVIRPEERERLEREVLKPLELSEAEAEAKVKVVPGGEERQDSTRAGIEALADREPELVCVHDGARPFFSEGLLERLIEAAREHGAAVPALPARETIRLADESGFAAGELPREQLRLIQTPQCFHYELLRRALKAASRQRRYFTDDAGAVVELTGVQPKLIEGEETNIKITTQLDLKLAELIAAQLQAQS